jgi:hypothetical protein
MSEDHPPPDSAEWNNPDLCPFCGVALSDGGVGFIDHIADATECEERFEAWREQIRDDIGGEWGG